MVTVSLSLAFIYTSTTTFFFSQCHQQHHQPDRKHRHHEPIDHIHLHHHHQYIKCLVYGSLAATHLDALVTPTQRHQQCLTQEASFFLDLYTNYYVVFKLYIQCFLGSCLYFIPLFHLSFITVFFFQTYFHLIKS